MIQKLSLLIPCDSTGVFLTRVFHIYQHKIATTGSYVKISVRETRPFNKIKKKKKCRSFVLRTTNKLLLPDTTWYCYSQNNNLILKKRLQVRGRVILGPTTYLIKKKKFLKSFVKIL